MAKRKTFKMHSKNASHHSPTFWIEKATEKDKAFFLGLGFEVLTLKYPESFGGDQEHLIFNGSSIFGMWTPEEYNRIVTAICDEYQCKSITIYEPNNF